MAGSTQAPDTTGPDKQELEQTVRLIEEGEVAELYIDDPSSRANVLSEQTMTQLEGAISALEGRRDLSVLLVRSGKPGMFIAGADVNEIYKLDKEEEAARKAEQGQKLFNRLEDLSFPTVALIDGACLGGGLELALACDYRIATDNEKTKIGLPETSLGILPGFGGTYRLPRVVGLSQALQMILTAKPVDGKKAAKIGLVDACYPQGFAEPWSRDFAKGIAGRKRRRRRPGGKRRPVAIRLLESPIGRPFLYRRSKKEVQKRTGGNYPAQPAALEVARKNWRSSRDKAMARESRKLGELAVTSVAKNLMALYFSGERAKKHPVLKSAGDARFEKAAVLGAGVMGGKIAWLFTKADMPVVMKDIAWDPVQKGFSEARKIYDYLKSRGKYDDREVNLKMHHLTGSVDYASIGDPDIVIEAVVERLDVKKKVLAELEDWVREDTIIASNTSSLSIDEMATALKRPERFGGMHYFNPPNRMPLVEVVSGSKTEQAVAGAIGKLALSLGKTPVFVKDHPGFLVNRLLMPYLNEAVIMAEEGIDIERIDREVERFGMPMGPFTLLDEIGIDVAQEVATVLREAYGDRMASGEVLGELAGRSDTLGKKSGKGFYTYRGKKRKPNGELEALLKKHRRRSGKELSKTEIVERPILAMANEAARALEEESVGSADELDLALVMGIGFPPFRGGLLRYADTLNAQELHSRLTDFAERLGNRFEPAPLVAANAKAGRGFYR